MYIHDKSRIYTGLRPFPRAQATPETQCKTGNVTGLWALPWKMFSSMRADPIFRVELDK